MPELYIAGPLGFLYFVTASLLSIFTIFSLSSSSVYLSHIYYFPKFLCASVGDNAYAGVAHFSLLILNGTCIFSSPRIDFVLVGERN